MKQQLFDLFVKQKKEFTKAMTQEIKDTVTFNPIIQINLPRDQNEFLMEITEVEVDPGNGYPYAHCFYTSLDMSTDEQWVPLEDLSMDDLFIIAEKI